MLLGTSPKPICRASRRVLSSVASTSVTFIAVAFISGCSGAPASNRESGAIAGAALGAGSGAIVGNQVGNTGGGVAIGAAAGAVAGAVVGDASDSDSEHEAYVKQRQEILRLQEKDIERQKKEIEDLRRQELHDASLRRYEDVK
jgi:uncharacterized membrane protein YebE (DUF533 family)